jgi:hypothetical protein
MINIECRPAHNSCVVVEASEQLCSRCAALDVGDSNLDVLRSASSAIPLYRSRTIMQRSSPRCRVNSVKYWTMFMELFMVKQLVKRCMNDLHK